MTWYINGTCWKLCTQIRREFGGKVTVTLYDGETLTVSNANIRTWKQ